MKTRIIETLQEFSQKDILNSNNTMFESISEELEISLEDLHEKSKQLLEIIVHNYAAFDISTIDKFNHKLIRVFAHDLKLPVNFEVELDTESVLNRAVDKLIDRAGTDSELTKILVDFAIEKADDDKSWDISLDFYNIAKLLTNENDMPFIELLKDKTLQDFKILKSELVKKETSAKQSIVEVAETVLSTLAQNGLEFSDFSRGTLPNHFKKAAELKLSGLYSNKLQGDLEERKGIYTKSLDADKAATIDTLLPELEKAYLTVKRLVFTSKFLENALKNITPLSVLNAIRQSLLEIKEEEDILLISEFNSIINSEIKTQPAPFIYERIGEKFKHYFIDEFQDTSLLQWENLVPLISNIISSENTKGNTGTAMIVGDAKQAIYRWRGGRAEQFIDLYSGNNPFFVDTQLHNLPANYRSYKAIVDFNNRFFKHVSTFAFTNPDHKALYEKSFQEDQLKHEGYVDIRFLDMEEEDNNKDACYSEAVFETIKTAQSQGFSLNDICIIVRKKKEGVAIAEFLTEKGMSIISSETLMIQNSPEVQFMNTVLSLSIQPNNAEAKVSFLNYLAKNLSQIEDKHAFLASMMPLKNDLFFEALQDYGYDFNSNDFSQLPLYEATESIIRTFRLTDSSDAYIQFYLDEILNYSQKPHASFQGFLDYWELKKGRLSIVSPSGEDAVQIMTIHKSKGLEFPVVIFPYANQDIYFDMRPKTWYPVEKTEFCDFSYLLLNLNKDLEDLSPLGAQVYQDYRSNLELDSLNLLYVVLTRAVEQLYVISELDLDKGQNEKPNLYSGLLINYLKTIKLWDPSQLTYTFGAPGKTSEVKDQSDVNEKSQLFISTKKEDHHLSILSNSGLLWDTDQAEAIERGNLVHDIMALINTSADAKTAFEFYMNAGRLNPLQAEQLHLDIDGILNHELLKTYYETGAEVYNERDIITRSGKILRPDRLVINSKKEVVIIDYKTGLPSPKHKEQLYDYQSVLEDMGYTVVKKILIFINHGISVKEL